MKILLVRPNFKNILSRIDIVNVEPLDLEYLYTACIQQGHECVIYDGQIELRSFDSVVRKYRPDIVGITGYVTMKVAVINCSSTVKNFNSDIKVIVGGVHAELNYEDFFIPTVDYVVHSGGIEPFKRIITSLNDYKHLDNKSGTCIRMSDNSWQVNPREIFYADSLPIPDRSHFYKYKKYFRYMEYYPCAVIKTAYGCPYSCSFCYCCLMNSGKYCTRRLDTVIEEISTIDCDNIWIVDDTFIVDSERVRQFADLIKKHGIKKNFIIYSRADLVVNNEDLMPILVGAGVKEMIVGLEAVDDRSLEGYNKGTTSLYNKECATILNRYGIGCTGLFILGTGAVRKDFHDIIAWGRENKLKYITASIFTPFPGTKDFEQYKDKLITLDYRKWDLLHLVMEPDNLSSRRYYYYFCILYLKIALYTLLSREFTASYIKYLWGMMPFYIKLLINQISLPIKRRR